MSPRRRATGFSPLGTARARGGQPAPGPAFPDGLRGALREHDLPEEALYLAWEIARLGRDLDDAARAALLHLALATLVAARQGSTRIPLPHPAAADEEGRYLDELLAALGIDGAGRAAVRALVDAPPAADGSRGGGVIGRPGDYLPLIRDGHHLYQQRMLHYEERLATALADRLRAPPVVDAASALPTASGTRAAPAARRATTAIDANPPPPATAVTGAVDANTAPAAARATTAIGTNPLSASADGAAAVDTALDDVRARPPRKDGRPLLLSDEQLDAVRRAVRSPLTVISGGPGTGKTSIVVSMLRVLARLGVPIEAIALAAPTGKAANRMEEAVLRSLRSVADPGPADQRLLAACPAPATLHRLLGYMPSTNRWRHHEHNRLGQEVVIVDECSMIDLLLMDQLVRSVAAGARLVLLGDADQLPSVDAGAVFRDLIPPPEPPAPGGRDLAGATTGPGGDRDPRRAAAVRLTRSYRMDPSDPSGRAVFEAARLINAGEAERLLAPAAGNVGATPAGRDVAASPAGRGSNPDGRDVAAAAAGRGRNRAGRDALAPAGGRGSNLVFAFAEVAAAGGGADPPLSRRASPEALAFEGVELVAAADDALLECWYRRRVTALPDFERRIRKVYRRGRAGFDAADRQDLDALLGHFERFRMLCLTRGDARETGAAAVNARLHQMVLDSARSDGDLARLRPALHPGEPVMMQQNDYDRGLWNGDQGLILRVAEGEARHHFMAVFPRQDDYVAFHLDALRPQLALAFAITVHKGQGSEFDHVAIILPDEPLPILTRELLYTAVSRARRSVVIAGSDPILRSGIASRLHRFSGLSSRLLATCP